jgi:hypothetical protein
MDVYPEFVLDEKLPRLVVTRQLLSEIETTCIATGNDLIRSDTQAGVPKLQIAVDDAYGTEIFASAANIPMSRFPETTSALRLEFSHHVEATPQSDKLSIDNKIRLRATEGQPRINSYTRPPIPRAGYGAPRPSQAINRTTAH